MVIDVSNIARIKVYHSPVSEEEGTLKLPDIHSLFICTAGDGAMSSANQKTTRNFNKNFYTFQTVL